MTTEKAEAEAKVREVDARTAMWKAIGEGVKALVDLAKQSAEK